MGNRKLPFGYKMVMGEIIIHPQEAQAVQGIYARYLAGASFNDITDHLKEKGPPYDADKPWNKNMVGRILEDSRYIGTDRFPAILPQRNYRKPPSAGQSASLQCRSPKRKRRCAACATAGPARRWNHRCCPF